MKKINLAIIAVLFAVLFSVGSVNAFECVYGYGYGNNWKREVVFEVNSYSDIDMRLENKNRFFLQTDVSDPNLMLYKGVDCGGCDWRANTSAVRRILYRFFINIYANEEAYKIGLETRDKYCADNNLSEEDCSKYDYLACPEAINLRTDFIWYFLQANYKSMRLHHYFYVDALTNEYVEDEWTNSVTQGEPILLRLEQSKDKDFPDDLTKGDNCMTYDVYIRILKYEAERDGGCADNIQFQKTYDDILRLCENYRASSDYADNYGKDEPDVSGCMTSCSKLRDDVAGICGYYMPEPDTDGSCYSLGDGVLGWIMKVLNMIRYGLPVILILLGILDFIKAISSDDEGEIKKAGSKFVKRLIAAALIFIVPMILKFVLGIFNLPGLDPSNPFCIGG